MALLKHKTVRAVILVPLRLAVGAHRHTSGEVLDVLAQSAHRIFTSVNGRPWQGSNLRHTV